MAGSDGNGWVQCRCGRRHWGRFGAAGLLLLRRGGDPAVGPVDAGRGPAAQPELEVLLQLRAAWTHEGGRWGLPGGARDSHEDASEAALREAAEEAGVDRAHVRILGVRPGVDHVDWRYTYVLALVLGPVRPRALTAESDDVRWVPVREVAGLPLHHGLESAWPELSAGLPQIAC